MMCPVCWTATKANICPRCGAYTSEGFEHECDEDADEDE